MRGENVVNATGVWADRIRPGELHSDAEVPRISPSRGTHVTLAQSDLPLIAGAIVPAGENRTIFALPWLGRSLIGTTDNNYDGDLDHVRPDPADIEYLLDALNAFFDVSLTPASLTGAFAGVRPLISTGDTRRSVDISRKAELYETSSGMVTITGGKLTTWRRMAKLAVDALVERDGRYAPCRTHEIPLGQAIDPDRLTRVDGVAQSAYAPLAARYGHDAERVLQVASERPELAAPIHPELPDIAAEAVYAVRHEQARTVGDVLMRRTRLAILAGRSIAAADSAVPGRIAALLAPELDWDGTEGRCPGARVRRGGRRGGDRDGRRSRGVSAPDRVMRTARGELALGGPIRLMGIVNATPDSFSDGGVERSLAARVELARAQLAAGAEVIDIGGESGVTNRPAVAVREEIERVLPVIERVVGELGATVSIDTYKPEVARAAIAAGAAIVNDVSALRDPELADVCAETGAGLILMHTRAAPKVKLLDRSFDGRMAADVRELLGELIELACGRGVAFEQLMLDPGPDFAKTPAQTIESMRALAELHAFGRPLLLAISRKDFIGALTGRAPRDRLAGTLAALGHGIGAGAHMARLHDVEAATDYIRVHAALSGEAEVDPELTLRESLRREPALKAEGESR